MHVLTLYNNFGANYLVMSKILSIIGRKKRIAGKKNRWEKKQNRLIPRMKCINNIEIIILVCECWGACMVIVT